MDENPPENYVFETAEGYYIVEDMYMPDEYDYYASEYWDGEDDEDE